MGQSRYSLLRALRAASHNDWSRAGYEADRSLHLQTATNQIAERAGQFFVPIDEITVPRSMLTRDLSVAGTGGFLVETENVGFIDLLRNRSVVMRMGAQRLTGLQGNVSIPKQTATGTATWLAGETSTVSEVNQTLSQVPLTPKTVGGYTKVSRQLLLQSNPSAEALVILDLARLVALAIDKAALVGTGANGEPAGILDNAYSIGSVSGTSLALAGMLELQSDCAAENALFETAGYVTTPAVASLLMSRMKVTDDYSPIWEGNMLDGRVMGFKAMSSNQMPAGTCLFGDFSQMIIAEWGSLAIDVNPYANFQAGIVGVRVLATVDIACRHEKAFSAASSIT